MSEARRFNVCPTCAGDPYDPVSHTNCPTCEGRGVVESLSDRESGWEIFGLQEEDGTISEGHVIPCGDIRRHTVSRACPCKPTQDSDEPRSWGHHAFDGREAFETGERKPS